jgi:hypothetical protein
MRNSEPWKSNVLEAAAYGISFLFVVAVCFYFRFGFEFPRHDPVTLEPGQSTVVDGYTIKRVN